MKKINIFQILTCLFISSCSLGMENLSLDTTMPCYEKKTYTYVDYIICETISNMDDVEPISGLSTSYLNKTILQAIEDLNTCYLRDGHPSNIYITLIRFHNESKVTDLSIEKLVELGAETGNWTVTEAIAKIKKHGSVKL